MGVPEMWPAQREAVEFALARPATMLDMGMGCGKTRVAIEVIKRRPEVYRVLVVCPKAVVPVWGRECAKYLYPGTYQVHERSASATVAKTAEAARLVLDLFPEERQEDRSPADLCVSWLVERHGCDEGRVRPLVAQLYRQFGDAEAFDRAKTLACFYGTHATQRLRACPPSLMGVFDQGIDYHTVWDRCWAAKWIPLQEVFEVAEWHYCQYKEPYTGAPAYVWYIDNEGREVKRPYEG